MAKPIVWADQAIADIRGIEQPVALRILHTLGRYSKTEIGDVKRVQGSDPPLSRSLSRLRAQNHRVLFHDKGNAIEVCPCSGSQGRVPMSTHFSPRLDSL